MKMQGKRKRIANFLQAIAVVATTLGFGGLVDNIQDLIAQNMGLISGAVSGGFVIVDHYIGTAQKREKQLNQKIKSGSYDYENLSLPEILKDQITELTEKDIKK